MVRFKVATVATVNTLFHFDIATTSSVHPTTICREIFIFALTKRLCIRYSLNATSGEGVNSRSSVIRPNAIPEDSVISDSEFKFGSCTNKNEGEGGGARRR